MLRRVRILRLITWLNLGLSRRKLFRLFVSFIPDFTVLGSRLLVAVLGNIVGLGEILIQHVAVNVCSNMGAAILEFDKEYEMQCR